MIAGTHIAFASTLYLGGAALFEYDADLVGWVLAVSGEWGVYVVDGAALLFLALVIHGAVDQTASLTA